MGSNGEGKGSAKREVISGWACPRLPSPGLPDWEAWGGGPKKVEAPAPPKQVAPVEPAPPNLMAIEFEKRLQAETRRSFDAGCAKGIEEGKVAERAAQGPVQQRLAAQIERMLSSFAEERDRFLQTVEYEVVKLALAVAARILRREAQMDPLLLTGAVRVALGQLAVSTAVRLRVPPTELDLWTESIALLPRLAVKPEVLPGEGMRLGDCIVETELGSVDLGVRAQLSEIERGFFDRAPSQSVLSEKAQSDAERRP